MVSPNLKKSSFQRGKVVAFKLTLFSEPEVKESVSQAIEGHSGRRYKESFNINRETLYCVSTASTFVTLFVLHGHGSYESVPECTTSNQP